MAASWSPWLPSSPSVATLLYIHDTAVAFLQELRDGDDPAQRLWAQRSLARLGGEEGALKKLREPMVAFLGAGAVGKSTLLNALLGEPGLLPSNGGPVAVTQNATDVVVDPSATVRVQYAQANESESSWFARRQLWAELLLSSMPSAPGSPAAAGVEFDTEVDLQEQRLSVGSVHGVLAHLYGAANVAERTFLERLRDHDFPDPNPAVRAALQLPQGVAIMAATSIGQLGALLRPLLAVPQRGALPAEAANHLYGMVDRVWISGPFPRALIPAGVHVLDLPGLNDISAHRRTITQGACKNADVHLLCVAHGTRWATDAWAAERRREAKLQGKQCAMVLTKSEEVFDDPAMRETALEQATPYIPAEVLIVHTAAKYALGDISRPPEQRHAGCYGLRTIADLLDRERQRVTREVLQVQERLSKTLKDVHADLFSLPKEEQGASARAASTLQDALAAAAQPGLQVATLAIEGAVAQLRLRREALLIAWPRVLHLRADGLAYNTLRCAILGGGTFASAGRHGLVDLPQAMQDELLRAGKLESIWQALFGQELPTAIQACRNGVCAVLQQAAAAAPSSLSPAAADTLLATLRGIVSTRRSELYAVLRGALVAALRPALRAEYGSGCQARMLAHLHGYMEHHCSEAYDAVVSAVSTTLQQTSRLLREEVTRAIAAAAVGGVAHGAAAESSGASKPRRDETVMLRIRPVRS